MSYTAADCQRSRKDFPALSRRVNGIPLAHLDGPGGTQVPSRVIEAITQGYYRCNTNVGGMFTTSLEVTAAVQATREAIADYLGAPSTSEISFGPNMTTLNFALSHALARGMRRGEEVVITQLDHEANRGPWLKLQTHGITIREAGLKPDGTLDLDDLARQVNVKTRVIAIGMASNALGTVTDITAARALAREVGAYLVLDAVHHAAHFPLDVVALDCDFLLCSAYKFYGPHIGILYARPGLLAQLDTDRLRTQKQEAPYRIETGTQNHPALLGVTAALEYLAQFGEGATRRERLVSAMTGISAYEHELGEYYYRQVRELPGVTVWGPAFGTAPRAPTVSITLDGRVAADVAHALSRHGLMVWSGHFYALRVLEVYDIVNRGGLIRTGISMYNTREEIDRLLAALETLTG